MNLARAQLQAVMVQAYRASTDHYRAAVAGELVNRPALESWESVRRIVARAHVLSKLVAMAGNFDIARRFNVPLEFDEFLQLPKATFAAPRKSIDFAAAFAADEFTEAVDLFRGRIPRLSRQMAALYAEADAMASAIVNTDRAAVVRELAAKSKAVREAIDRSFWAADVNKATVINLKELVGDAVGGFASSSLTADGKVQVDGVTLPDFIDRASLEGAGHLTDARLETIYRNNLNSAFTDANLASMSRPEVRTVIPAAMLTNPRDPRSRKTHATMHGYICPADQVRERGLATPCGHNCRCDWRPATIVELRNLGLINAGGELDMDAVRDHNGAREDLITSGQYPDPGFRSA